MAEPEWYADPILAEDEYETEDVLFGTLSVVRDRLATAFGEDSEAVAVVDAYGSEEYEKGREWRDTERALRRAREAEAAARDREWKERERQMEPARQAAAEGTARYEQEIAQTIPWGSER